MAFSDLVRDLRFAVRAFSREKTFTVAALLSLALGIGANTALFSVVYGVLMRPLPYREPEGLIRISEFHPHAAAGVPGTLLTNFTYNAWKDARTISGIADFKLEQVVDSSGAEPAPVTLFAWFWVRVYWSPRPDCVQAWLLRSSPQA